MHFGGDVLAVQFSDGHLEIRRPADGSLVLALPGTPDTGNGFAISADGRWLSRIDDDARVQLFDLTTGRTEPFGVFGTALRGILSHTVLAYTATGDRLVLALEGDGSDAFPGEIQQWRLSAADWLQTACRTANRTLTGAEWDTYVGDRPRPEGC